MRLKISYQRGGGLATVDLLIDADPSTTVGALADQLAASDPERPRTRLGALSLELTGPRASEIDPAARLTESGIWSGATVALTEIGGRFANASATAPAAVVVIVAGPDKGREFPIGAGTSVIGRDRSCEVRLSDPLVSRQHARINVGEVVDLIDLGSANGLALGDDVAERLILRPGDRVTLGDTVLGVRVLARTGVALHPASVHFNRPPRVDERFHGVTMAAPEPPSPQQTQRFPILPLFAPLILGLVLYLSTHAVTSLIFVAMSPLLIVANATEGRLSGRKAYAAALQQFRTDLTDLVNEASAAQHQEQVRRLGEHPSALESAEASAALSPLLWSRWPDLPGFAELRLGLGIQPSRNRIEPPTNRQPNRALWRELTSALTSFATVDGVPVIAKLDGDGALGIGGSSDPALGVARSLVVQAVALHSPAELTLVVLTSSESAAAWDWCKWLPHCLSLQSPLASNPLASTEAGCATLLAELTQLVTERETAEARSRRDIPAVLVILTDDAPIIRSAGAELARRGTGFGVHVLWIAPDVTALPAACRTFIDVGGDDRQGAVGFVHTGERVAPLTLEPVAGEIAFEMAKRLSNVVDATAAEDTQSNLPRSVSLLSLVGRDLGSSAEAVIDRWTESRSIRSGPRAAPREPDRRYRPGTLRAIVGESSAGPHVLDLQSQGPHALVGGTTGSGKSELLQSWILGMALTNSPQRVTFLLVDYKGGSAFSECADLPHTVGLVTDLRPRLVRRALTSLAAELRFREQALQKKNAKDLMELERRGDPDAPPSLIIIVDEFAALIQEVPEFVDGVVDVAQRGRSLGLHLILATQRPAGVIRDNLRANTNLRLALRVADEENSLDVIGSAEAAHFDAALPGRAVSRTGPSQLIPFQAAYAGGWTSEKPTPAVIEIGSLGFGPKTTWEMPSLPETEVELGATDIQRIVTTIGAANSAAELAPPRRPWLNELATLYDLGTIPTRRRDDELVFAVGDDPERQAQPTIAFHPDEDGNLAVYGTGNSGKSTLLRTLAVAAGFTVRGGPCQIYGIEFGARGLAPLEELPHVGSVIAGLDHERVGRLLTTIRSMIDERASRYSRVGAGTITDYRRIAEEPNEPRLLLLVDGIGAFRTAYEGNEHARLFDTFLGIAADGRPVGVHVAITADRPGAVPVALSSHVQRRVVLRLADQNDYSSLGLAMDVLDADAPPGRGVLDGLEIQVAVLGRSADLAVQTRELEGFARSMRAAGYSVAPAIDRLPELVTLAELPATVTGFPTLGVSGETLTPVGFEPRGTFVVTGPPSSGRTTALATVLTSLRRWRPDVRIVYFGNRRSPLLEMFSFEDQAVEASEVTELASKVPDLFGEASPEAAPCVVVIEGITDFVNGPADLALQAMTRTVVTNGHLLVSDGEPAAMSASYPLLLQARAGRSGIVLQPEQSDGVVFRANFPRLRRQDFPLGRGLFVPRGGHPTVVQVATP